MNSGPALSRSIFLAQTADMHVYRAHIAHVIVFPDRFQQRLAAVYLAAVGDEQLKQVKLLGRQAHGLAAERHGAVLAVDLQIVHADDALFLLHFVPAAGCGGRWI